VAVLPFLNLTGDSGNDHICDGLAEELTDTLARVPELRVVARTSAFQFKGKAQDVRTIGARLNAGHVIEGSVSQMGGRVRLTIQMVRTSDGYHVLSRSLEGRLLDLAGLQTDLAVPLIASLRPGAKAPQRRKPVPEAHDLLFRASAYRGTASMEGYQKGLALLQQAVQVDPGYAEAYAALAGVYATSGANFEPTALECARLAKAAAARALELDRDCAAAYGALGFVDSMYLLDWIRGEDELRHALRLMPSAGGLHNWLGNVLMYQGRLEEALIPLRKAQEIDPLSAVNGLTEGLAYFYARRHDAALEKWRFVQRAHPEATLAHLFLGRAHQARGAYDEAMQEYRKVPPAVGDFMVAALLAVRGQAKEARDMLGRLEHPAPGAGPPRAFNLACIRAALGDREEAFGWLERAYEDRKISQLIVEPYLDPLRQDRRYIALVKKAGFSR
jgi:TolB-like protein/Flp pilus assembly protein TadD